MGWGLRLLRLLDEGFSQWPTLPSVHQLCPTLPLSSTVDYRPSFHHYFLLFIPHNNIYTVSGAVTVPLFPERSSWLPVNFSMVSVERPSSELWKEPPGDVTKGPLRDNTPSRQPLCFLPTPRFQFWQKAGNSGLNKLFSTTETAEVPFCFHRARLHSTVS